MSPEAKRFTGRLFVTVLVLGTLFGFVVVVINALGTVVERQNAQVRDQAIRQGLASESADAPIEERIRTREDAIGRLTDDVGKREESRKLAALYSQRGQRFLNQGRIVEASSDFEMARQTDPANPEYAAQAGNLYNQRARQETDLGTKRTLIQQAADAYAVAAKYETDPTRREQFATASATLFYNLAVEQMSEGGFLSARELLYQARKVAMPGTQIEGLIEQALRTLTE
jgi:hypothetical protein